MLRIIYAECRKQVHYAECRYAECCGALHLAGGRPYAPGDWPGRVGRAGRGGLRVILKYENRLKRLATDKHASLFVRRIWDRYKNSIS